MATIKSRQQRPPKWASSTKPTTVIVDIFEQEHSCITIDEIRWIMRRCKRHSPHYTFFLLRLTKGIRTRELLENVRLNCFFDNFYKLKYTVDKPKKEERDTGEVYQFNKHRVVELDEWVRNEVLAYFEQYFAVVEVEGGKRIYVSPYKGQRLFPFRKPSTIRLYWNKMRHLMSRAGFDAYRLHRQSTRQDNGKQKNTFVLRPHILRHFAATVHYYQEGKDIVKTRTWIGHSRDSTTSRYLHSAKALNSTEEEICKPWPSILGFDAAQRSLTEVTCPTQKILNSY